MSLCYFTDYATPDIYTIAYPLSLPDALPIYISGDTDDELYPDTANAVFAKVKFFSRGGVPDMTLVIK